MIDLGIVRPGSTIYLPFASFAGSTGASAAASNLAVGDILIYKDGSTTQRASTSGFTLLDTDGLDFDGTTGINGVSIDLADNTTAGFYAAGSRYFVVIGPITVDTQTVNFVAATFAIGYPAAVLNTTIATLSSQTSFTLTAGPAEDDALNGLWVVIHDVASAVQLGTAVIDDYTGSSKTVTLAAGTTFTVAASDNIAVMGPAPLQPTTAGRKLDVSSGGEAGVDWANVGSPTTSVNLSATTISTSQVVASVSGAVGSVTGAVGSVTGNVGGNVTGSVGSVTGNVGGNVTGTIGGLTAAALKDFFDTDSTTTFASAVAGSVVKEIADNAGGGLTSTDIAETVCTYLFTFDTGETYSTAVAGSAVSEIVAGACDCAGPPAAGWKS